MSIPVQISCTTGYVRNISNETNDRGYILIPNNANRLYFDNIVCSTFELGQY